MKSNKGKHQWCFSKLEKCGVQLAEFQVPDKIVCSCKYKNNHKAVMSYRVFSKVICRLKV